MSPDATIPTGRNRYLIWEKNNPTATTIRTMAIRIRVPIEVPISSPICCWNAGSPVTTIRTPGGGLESVTIASRLSRTEFFVSCERPGSRVITPIVSKCEGMYREEISEGMREMTASSSAEDRGRTPPFICVTMEAILDVPVMYRCCEISSSSLSRYRSVSRLSTSSLSTSSMMLSDWKVSVYSERSIERGESGSR